MKKYSLSIFIAIAVFLVGCAVSPRSSTWNSPARFDSAQVFNAAMQAGPQRGMQLVASDRESGTMSFKKQLGKGDFILNVIVSNTGKMIVVRTTAHFGGGGQLGIAGLHEGVIEDYHKHLFNILNITDPAETNVSIKSM